MSKNSRSGRKQKKSIKPSTKEFLPQSTGEESTDSAVGPEHAPEYIIDANERKNMELRWLRHFSAARKLIASADFQGAVLELQSSVKFAERLADFRLANSFAELGFVALKLSEFETARSFIRFAIEARTKLYGSCHPSIAVEYNNLAMTYEWSGDYSQASIYLETAVSILDMNGQFDAANQAEPYEGLAAVLLGRGAFNRAAQLCMKALQIRDEHLGRLHPLSIKTVQFLMQIHQAADHVSSLDAARAIYTERLNEYAATQTPAGDASALKRLLDARETTPGAPGVDACISDFLKLMARG